MSIGSSPAAVGPGTFAEVLWPARPGTPAGTARALILAVLGSALLVLSAKARVPLGPVPITMQSMVVVMLGAAYGWRLGALTVLLYLAEGLAGLPVFTNTPPAAPGPLYFAGPTGGFLIGFVAAAATTGWLAERGWERTPARLLAAMAIGHVVLFAPGYAWLSVLMGPAKAWAVGVEPFILATLLKTALAAALTWAGWTLLRR
jgi:biotin transport system substrate-specific component